jgi:hypothetical protein
VTAYLILVKDMLYHGSPDAPKVMYLRWSCDGQSKLHQWVETHPTFEAFAAAVGLDRMLA